MWRHASGLAANAQPGKRAKMGPASALDPSPGRVRQRNVRLTDQAGHRRIPRAEDVNLEAH